MLYFPKIIIGQFCPHFSLFFCDFSNFRSLQTQFLGDDVIRTLQWRHMKFSLLFWKRLKIISFQVTENARRIEECSMVDGRMQHGKQEIRSWSWLEQAKHKVSIKCYFEESFLENWLHWLQLLNEVIHVLRVIKSLKG